MEFYSSLQNNVRYFIYIIQFYIIVEIIIIIFLKNTVKFIQIMVDMGVLNIVIFIPEKLFEGKYPTIKFIFQTFNFNPTLNCIFNHGSFIRKLRQITVNRVSFNSQTNFVS